MSGFIYIWRDQKLDRYYIGSHWGSPDDGYICSSQKMRDNHRNRPDTFKRRILKTINTSREELLKEEQRWLEMIPKEEFGRRYYNANAKATGYYWWVNEETRKQVGKKITKANKRRIKDGTSPFANNDFQIAMSKKAHASDNHPFHGGLCTELKERMESGTHHFQTDHPIHTMMKDGRWKLGEMNKKEYTCPHCGKIGKGPTMLQYHFEHCKKKKAI